MSRSTKGKSPINAAGRNPIKSAGPYEVSGVGEDCAPKGPSLKQAPAADPVVDDGADEEG